MFLIYRLLFCLWLFLFSINKMFLRIVLLVIFLVFISGYFGLFILGKWMEKKKGNLDGIVY